MARKKSRVSAKAKKQAVRKASMTKPKASARPPSKGKWVYAFGDGRAEGKAGMRNLLGLSLIHILTLPTTPYV
jgi:pyruvate,orthophosphate dikinase